MNIVKAANEKPGLLEQDRAQSKKHDDKVSQKSKSVKNWLTDFHTRSKLKRSEIVEILQIAYPGFDKGLLSKCEHPEKYGVMLTAKARKHILDEYERRQKHDPQS